MTFGIRALRHPRSRQQALALALLCVLPAAASAAGSCGVSSSGLAFPSYQPLTFAGKLTSAPVTTTADVVVTCFAIATAGAYTLSLGPGTHGGGDRISTRYMNNISKGGALMAFNVYTDSGYSLVWGNSSIGQVLGGTLEAATGTQTRIHTVYGRVPAGQNTLQAGSFSESMTITISYSP